MKKLINALFAPLHAIRNLSAGLFPKTDAPKYKSIPLVLDTLGERLVPAVLVPKPTTTTTQVLTQPADTAVVTVPKLDLRFGQSVSKLSMVASDGECGNNSPKTDPLDPRNKVDPTPTGGDDDPRVILLGVAVR